MFEFRSDHCLRTLRKLSLFNHCQKQKIAAIYPLERAILFNMVWLAWLLPLVLVPIVSLLPLLLDLIMAKVYAFFGWQYRMPVRTPPACPHKPTAPINDGKDMEKSSGCVYEVFLSFRGPDTRTDITDYLYTSMIGAGIRVYKDDEDLRPGEEISDQLLQAIEQSKVSIPIFSKGYADSTWCLRELVKMVESKNTRGQKIMPIFYDVAPSEVKYQKACYKTAFAYHLRKKRLDRKTIKKWEAALTEVGQLKGWDLQSKPDRGKGEFVKEVVNDVLVELKTPLEVSDCLVEVDNHVDEIMRMIGAHSDVTRIVGIHGIPGVGKTTLAEIVYNRLFNDFSDCCYLSEADVKEGKKQIEERLRSKRVLLLLDDAHDACQLGALVQKREWFGRGSKIIITTRNRGILKVPTLVDEAYELTGMDWDHSLRLFYKHAFGRDYPEEQYISGSKRAVKICGGLPLALEVIGSLLYKKTVNEWDRILKELEKSPPKDVEERLMMSVEALNDDQRRIFLDVACFFIGYDERIVSHMWEHYVDHPYQSLGILQQRSLIKIREDNRLWMHDLLRDIGRNSILKGSGKKPEKQQMVWTHEQASEVLEKMQIGGDVHGISNIEAICLKIDELSQYSQIKECLPRFLNLMFLQVESKDFKGNTKSILQTTSSPPILPVLRWLSWNYCHMDFELTNFSLRKLVILDLSMSEITEEWNGWSHIKLAVDLKVINLTRCHKLRKTPDMSSHVNLERLILEGCKSLVQIDPSIGHLKKLVFLNLKYCGSLQELPDEMGALESLMELLLDWTSIQKIPEWRRMKKLEILSLKGCKSLKKFSFVGCATSAVELSSVDSPLTRLPRSIGNFSSLIELDLSWSRVKELPDSIGNMKNLKVLKLVKSSVRRLPNLIGTLEKLEQLEAGADGLEEIPDNIGKLSRLRILALAPTSILTLPLLPKSLIELGFTSFSIVKLPDLSNLSNLRKLVLLLPCKLLGLEEAPRCWWIGRLHMLESLQLTSPNIITLPFNITHLSQLTRLKLACNNLQSLPRLPTSLRYLEIICRLSLHTVIDISNLKALLLLSIQCCDKLTEIQGLEGLENLIALRLFYLPSLAELPDLTKLKKLGEIKLHNCPKLGEIQLIPESLKKLEIENCLNLQKLPDPSRFKHLKVWQVKIAPHKTDSDSDLVRLYYTAQDIFLSIIFGLVFQLLPIMYSLIVGIINY